MIKKIIILAAIVIIGGAIVYFVSQKIRPKPAAMPPQPERVTKELLINLLPQTAASVSGRVTIFEKDQKTTEFLIQLNLFSAKDPKLSTASAFSAQIHAGSCQKVKDVKYTLANVVNTASRSVLPVNLKQITKNESIIITIEKSGDTAEIIACGNFP